MRLLDRVKILPFIFVNFLIALMVVPRLLNDNINPVTMTAKAEGKEKICLVQSDSRPLKHPSNGEFPDDIITAHLYYHHYYATLHGYKAIFYKTVMSSELFGSWGKIRALKRAILEPECDIVLLLEGDAFISNPRIPIQTLLKRWNFTADTWIALPEDPDEPINYSDGVLALNTGTVFVRKGLDAFKLLDDIEHCPYEIEGCDKWKKSWPSEQGAFTTQFSPHLKFPSLVRLPCTEANGFRLHETCKGEYIVHPWLWKDEVIPELRKRVYDDIELLELHERGVKVNTSLNKVELVSNPPSN
jgi:hypothetical protein